MKIIDPLTAELAVARRRQILAAASDTLTIALVVSSTAHGAMALAGLPAMWILPAGWVAVCAAMIARRYTLLNIAHELDAAGRTGDLISSAWLVRNSLTEPWAAMLHVQALARIESLVADKNWHRLPSRLRSTLLLTAAALLAMTALLKPAADTARVAAMRDALLARASAGAARVPAWVAPQQIADANDNPDEHGRSITGESDQAVRRSGDDSAGHGRADAATVARLHSPFDRSSIATAQPSGDARDGDGSASPADLPTIDRPSGDGVVETNTHQTSGQSHVEYTATLNDSDRSSLAVAPAYRDIVRDYFER